MHVLDFHKGRFILKKDGRAETSDPTLEGLMGLFRSLDWKPDMPLIRTSQIELPDEEGLDLEPIIQSAILGLTEPRWVPLNTIVRRLFFGQTHQGDLVWCRGEWSYLFLSATENVSFWVQVSGWEAATKAIEDLLLNRIPEEDFDKRGFRRSM